MKYKRFSFVARFGSSLLAGILAPGAAYGCACGCGVFDVGTESMLPGGPGWMVFTEFDYQDQIWNWSGSSRSPEVNNADQEIRTYFTTLGAQYMFDRTWGAQIELPYDVRYYKGSGGSTTWGSLGDLRVQGIYTGFFEDMSAGLTYGLKLPTGNFHYDDSGSSSLLDRDTELGTGSTDILFGGFYRHPLSSVAHGLYWFTQFQLDVPVLIQDDYRPGIELDTVLGLYYEGLSLGKVGITPVAQVIYSERTRDTGSWASGGVNDPPVGESDSGYQRVLLSPGLEFDLHRVKVYADAEVPVYDWVRGNQLVAPVLFKLIVSYMF